MDYIYLHGFASSQSSAKGVYLAKKFAELGLTLQCLDLNVPNFREFTYSGARAYIARQLDASCSYCLIGSSLGGLLSLSLAEEFSNIQQLLLLAPALGIGQLLPELVGEAKLQQWQMQGAMPIYHAGAKQECWLNYAFVEDLQQCGERDFKRAISSLILHGQQDATIPIALSRAYQARNPNCQLIELQAEHGLELQLPQIWQAAYNFFGLSGKLK